MSDNQSGALDRAQIQKRAQSIADAAEDASAEELIAHVVVAAGFSQAADMDRETFLSMCIGAWAMTRATVLDGEGEAA